MIRYDTAQCAAHGCYRRAPIAQRTYGAPLCAECYARKQKHEEGLGGCR